MKNGWEVVVLHSLPDPKGGEPVAEVDHVGNGVPEASFCVDLVEELLVAFRERGQSQIRHPQREHGLHVLGQGDLERGVLR